MSRTETSFERFEYKYWVPDLLVQELLRAAAPYLQRDEMAEGGQRNTSLYLDTDDYDFAWAHTESAPDRLKLRVRAYGDPPHGPAFFEIKRKVKAVSLKRRAIVPIDHVPALLGGEIPAALRLDSDEERRTLDSFLYLMIVNRAAPRLLVTCRREAFRSRFAPEGVRLTLDRDICYQPAPAPSLQGDPAAWQRLCGLRGYEAVASTLIELKFRGLAPRWVTELIERFDLRAGAYSKYVSAVTHAELGPAGPAGEGLVPTALALGLAGRRI